MRLDRVVTQIAKDILPKISPVGAIAATGIKTSGRLGKTFISFGKGGWYNPTFYFNSLSAGFSGTSLALQCVSYCTSATCPAIALPLYGLSQMCGATADVIDSSLGVATLIL